MAEEGTLCINADVLKKAGTKASSTSTAEAYTNFYIKLAEGQICAAARYDYVTNYSSLSTVGKHILRDATSSYAAFYAVDYDPTGFTTTQYLQKLNSLWAGFQKLINLLEKDTNYKEFIYSGSGTIS